MLKQPRGRFLAKPVNSLRIVETVASEQQRSSGPDCVTTVEPQGLITLRPRYGLRMTLERRTDVKAA